MSRNLLTKSYLLTRVLQGFSGRQQQSSVFFLNHLRTLSSDGNGSPSVKSLLQESLSKVPEAARKELKGVFAFDVSGRKYVIDANAAGPLTVTDYVEGTTKVDSTFTLDETSFMKIAKGEMKATGAFMSGKMKISGDMAKAMKYSKIVK